MMTNNSHYHLRQHHHQAMIGRSKAQLWAIRAKLDLLGAWREGGDYTAPASLAALELLEQQHGVRLPTGYRQFVTNIHAGGLGPYYGITPLEYALPDLDDPLEAVLLRQNFPFTPEAALERCWQPVKCAAGTVFPPGVLYLAHQKLGYYAFLVVSGPAEGRVVYLNLDQPTQPYFVADQDFLSWYSRWLDYTVVGRRPAWFAYDNPQYLVEVAHDQHDNEVIYWQTHPAYYQKRR
jgi:hypothetical protein